MCYFVHFKLQLLNKTEAQGKLVKVCFDVIMSYAKRKWSPLLSDGWDAMHQQRSTIIFLFNIIIVKSSGHYW